MTPNVDALIAAATFDDRGLCAAIAQDHATGVVRMQAWVNAEAVRATASSGQATFWSRSRNELWQKGATSGNVMAVREIRVDCDGDAILYVVDAGGPSCHTGKTSCFFRPAAGQTLAEDDGPAEVPAAILTRVAQVIAARRAQTSEKSYVASLLNAGYPKIAAKIQEEAGELCEALPEGDAKHTAHEAADLIFHVLVGLEAAQVPMDEVFAVLRGRFGTSGHVEKAARPPKT